MLRIAKPLLALAIVLNFCSWTKAEETPLQYFSGDVDVLIRLREPDQTLEKVSKLADKIQPGVGTQIKSQQDAILGQMISNATLTGVDQSRDWYAGVYTRGEAPPMVVFAIPALKAEDLVSALGSDMTSEVQDRWVLYTDGDALPKADRTNSAASKFQESSLSLFTSGDLNVYVNIEHLSTVYANQIELAQDKVLEGLNQLRFLPQQNGVNLDAVVDIYGRIAEAFFQGVDDGQSSIVSISLNEDDIAFDKHVTFTEGSAFSKSLAENKQDSIPLITKLPQGEAFYLGFSGDMKAFTKFGLKMSMAMMEQKEKTEKLDEQLSKLDDIKFGAGVSSIGIVDSDSGMLRSANLFVAEPIDKVRNFNRGVMEITSNLETPQLKQTTTIQEDAETYGNFKGDIVTIKQEFNGDADISGIQKKMQQAMFGDAGMQTRIVYMDGKYASTLGGGEAAMKSLIADLNSEKSNSLVKLREDLMPKANLLTFLDLPGLIGNVLRAGSRVEGFPLQVNGQMIDSLNLKPSYISLALGSDPNVLKSQLRVPVDQIIGMTKLGILISGGLRPGL